jgi:hypothetical protein
VDFDLEGVPAGAYTALSDDPVHAWNATRPGGREFDLTLAPEGNWYHGANSDGGIVGGLPTDWGWCITVHPNFIAGIIAWQYQKPMSDWNIELDMDQPVTICYIPPMPTRHSSWVRDPKYDHEPGPAYGDILKAGVDGPVGYWTGSDWEPAIILRMQVHGRIPDTAPPCMPTTISSFSWRFDLDGDGAWDVVILIESDGAPGDPDPGAGTWSLVKWTQELMGYDSVMGTFRIIHESWPGWGDVDKLEVIVPLGELGYATGFDWIALNTHWPAWLDQAPDSGWAPW